jgi:uncharacterized LabA/DUF88 family protein
MRADRAAFFVDGSNWYHGCASLGLRRLGQLNFARLCQRLARNRRWIATRYYVGLVPRTGDTRLASEQQRFLARLRTQDARISVHLGRLEPRHVANETAAELKRYLAGLEVRIDPRVYGDLFHLAEAHARVTVMVEKAVDVQIAVDLVSMADRDAFDAAFLLSADSDLAPAVEAVKAAGKTVFVVSPQRSAHLAAASDQYLRIGRDEFRGLFD